MRAPGEEDGPVRIITPDSASACPTVGANCRRYVTADAIGVAKERDKTEVNDAGAGGGIGDKHNEDPAMYLGSGLSGEIKPLLLLV